MTDSEKILTFASLANDYCKTIHDSATLSKEEFIDSMLRLLPRLYLSMNEYVVEQEPDMNVISSYMDEEHYSQVCNAIAALMGEDDTYLETFMEDMKYSDTPIAASISESLADIYQDMYNFTLTMRESEGTIATQAMDEMHENFSLYWSKTLCNVMRPLNALKYTF